jgi:hypothetical protein
MSCEGFSWPCSLFCRGYIATTWASSYSVEYIFTIYSTFVHLRSSHTNSYSFEYTEIEWEGIDGVMCYPGLIKYSIGLSPVSYG